MKLIIQIPCYNEEHTLPATLADLPKHVEGCSVVEVLVIDDGSTDRTVQVAKELGVNHIVSHKNNRGLARTFRTGIDSCLALGADIIVNTDGDNQYAGQDISKLCAPIIAGEADIVIGDRQTDSIAEFSWLKKKLQRIGSYVVRTVSETKVADVVSGFRAISKDAAMMLNIVSPFSYTIEMVIQAGKKHLPIESVPIQVNRKTRKSRLFRNIPSFIQNQVSTIVRMYAMYQPLRVFFYIGSIMILLGLPPIVRFLYLFMFMNGSTEGHVQSLVLGGACVIIGFLAYLIGLVSDLISKNRELLEMTLQHVRRIEMSTEQLKHRSHAE